MSMTDRIKALPPFPDDGNVGARLRAIEARNALLSEALANMCEAWEHVRGEYPREVAEVLHACRLPAAA